MVQPDRLPQSLWVPEPATTEPATTEPAAPEPATTGGAPGLSGGDATWVPTELARGPWSRDALHGGPVAAILARAVERCDPDAARDMHVARFTLELLRPVPVAPLGVRAYVSRPGYKVQVVDAHLTLDGTEVARARAVRLRTATGSGPGEAAPSVAPRRAPFAGPDEAVAQPSPRWDYPGFHNAGADLRFASGGMDEPGPAAVWIRLAVPVVPGEAPSPLQRVVAAADFGNGVSAVLPFEQYRFINPDLTVSCAHPASGEWVGLEAETSLGTPGIGVAQSVLWDTGGAGPVGRAVQSLLVEAR
ncbi:MAG: thioesterase family protein [Acidimicrobiales bacterium]